MLRTAPIVHRTSPPLAQLLPLFKLGLGARLGDGRQYFPMVSLRDWLDGVALPRRARHRERPVQPLLPAHAHQRASSPTPWPRPSGDGPDWRRRRFVLEKAAGRLANELLGSVRSEPAALVAAGFTFQDEDVRDVLAAALTR